MRDALHPVVNSVWHCYAVVTTATIRLRFDDRLFLIIKGHYGHSDRHNPLAAVALTVLFIKAAVQQPRTVTGPSVEWSWRGRIAVKWYKSNRS